MTRFVNVRRKEFLFMLEQWPTTIFESEPTKQLYIIQRCLRKGKQFADLFERLRSLCAVNLYIKHSKRIVNNIKVQLNKNRLLLGRRVSAHNFKRVKLDEKVADRRRKFASFIFAKEKQLKNVIVVVTIFILKMRELENSF